MILALILLLASVVAWSAFKHYVAKRSQSVLKTALEQEGLS